MRMTISYFVVLVMLNTLYVFAHAPLTPAQEIFSGLLMICESVVWIGIDILKKLENIKITVIGEVSHEITHKADQLADELEEQECQ